MSRKPRTIALVTSALGCHSRAFCEGAADYIRNHCGWSVRLILRGDIRSAATLRAYDGVIVREIRKREYEILESCGKPVVEAAVKGTGSPRFASVDCDEKALAGLAARHFLSRGFTSLAFCGYRGVAFSDVRERHFTAAVRAAGRTVRCFPEEEGRFAEKLIEVAEPDEESFVRWVLGLPKGTGVFCANDVLAHQLLAVCMANRIKVPHDLSILGADDDFLLCNINNPSLSSISLNANGIGVGAARLLERILDGGVKGDIGRMHEEVPPGRLRVRNSTEVYRMGPAWLSDALVYIDRNAAKVSASDVYRFVKRSHTAVDAAFSEIGGTTVQKRILGVRMEEAKRLLEDETISIAYIAETLGFPSVQYFSSTFKLHFNATPAAYRRAHVRGEM